MKQTKKQIKEKLNSLKHQAKEFLKKNAILRTKAHTKNINRNDVFPKTNPINGKIVDYYITDWGEIMLVDIKSDVMVEIMKKETFRELYGDWFNGPIYWANNYPLENSFIINNSTNE